jgi:hypothetical protein
MEQLIGVLIQRMVRKGMEITTIPAYIRDLTNTLAVNGYLSLGELNGRLGSLGWKDFELDDYTLQLIMATFEPDLAYKPPHWFDQAFNPKRLTELAEKKALTSYSNKTLRPLQE